jgi:hypothetical protein
VPRLERFLRDWKSGNALLFVLQSSFTRPHGPLSRDLLYRVAEDTFYVGTLKGVGRVYQRTAIDTSLKVGFAKRYTSKTLITAAETLNGRVLPDCQIKSMLLQSGWRRHRPGAVTKGAKKVKQGL